jgi:PPK2 family polyphosphate:nucleotide phosphotransferase
MPDLHDFVQPFRVPPGKKISLKKDYDPRYSADYVKKSEAGEMLAEGVKLLADYQDKFYAESTDALLIILQAMDAAGKDGAIKHVMSGLNPQGTHVTSFKVPSAEELDHDYMWRNFKVLPERGRIGIFNRSYYEEVLVVRVHPQILAGQSLPPALKDDDIWQRRFREMNNFEEYLTNNGIHVVKLFLNVSKEEQKKRFLERIERPEKNWKFSAGDVKERAFWDDYMAAYEDVLNHTSTDCAPWYVIPADRKWFTRLAVAAVVIAKMQEIDPQYPTVSEAHQAELLEAKAALENEQA